MKITSTDRRDLEMGFTQTLREKYVNICRLALNISFAGKNLVQ